MGVTDELASDEARAGDGASAVDPDRVDEAGPGSSPDEARPDDDPRLVRLTLALAVLPFAVSAVALLVSGRGHHIPTGDHAMIEALTRDVFTRPPLIGLYSRADWSHPGPLQFYALAPIYWLTGGASIGTNLGALVINGASVVGTALIARRRGGLPLMLCTVIASGLLIRTLGADFMHDPWNTYLPVFSYALLVFLAWSLACGERWALPVGVVVGSFIAQMHIGFVALGIPLLLWGAGMLLLRTARGEWRWTDPQARKGWFERLRPLWPSAGLATAIGVVLWLPPLMDVIANRPSNARRVIDWFGEADEGTKTIWDGVRVMFGQFKPVPEWLTVKQDIAFPIGESPYLLGPFPWPVLLLPVGVAAAFLWLSPAGDAPSRALRDDRRHLLGLLGVMLVVGIVAVSRTVGPAFDYRLRWTWILPMFTLVTVAWAAWLALTRWRPAARRWLTYGAAALLAVVVGVNSVTAARAGKPYEGETDVIATLGPQVQQALPEGAGQGDGVVLVTEPFHMAAVYSRGLAWYLEREGLNVRMEPTLELHLGPHRVYDGEPVDAVLLVMPDDGIEAVAGIPELEVAAEWTTGTAAAWEEERAEREGLDLAYVAGEIDQTEYFYRKAQLESPESTAAYAHRVTVFLDGRRPVEPHLGAGQYPMPW